MLVILKGISKLLHTSLTRGDVSSVESARTCAEEILKEHSVDVLINNAGAVFEEKKKNDDGVEITFVTGC